MKNFNIKKIVILAVGIFALVTILYGIEKKQSTVNMSVVEAKDDVGGYYTCSMHPQIHKHEPGNCPICGMKLIYKKGKHVHKDMQEANQNNPYEASVSDSEKSSIKGTKGKILYYRNPMDPKITSATPMKDSMGMDFVPVYDENSENENQGEESAGAGDQNTETNSVVIKGVHISTERQQLIGVKRAKVIRRKILRELRTTGSVAYDPELAMAVREYMNTPGNEILRQSAYSRLRLLGMGESEIRQLSQGQNAASYTSLYLPEKGGAVWVYATLYEGDTDKVKTGDIAKIQLPENRNLEFTGKIHSLSITVDAMTRTIRVRIYVPGAGGKLLPDTYVNVTLYSEKGEALVVPQSALVDTGERQMVFVIENGNRFVPRIVHAGTESGDMVAILTGLKEGETVVSSATFLIDSETQLNAPMSEPEH